MTATDWWSATTIASITFLFTFLNAILFTAWRHGHLTPLTKQLHNKTENPERNQRP